MPSCFRDRSTAALALILAIAVVVWAISEFASPAAEVAREDCSPYVAPKEVDLVVVGPDRPVSVDQLGSQLGEELGRDVTVTVRWVPDERFVVEGSS